MLQKTKQKNRVGCVKRIPASTKHIFEFLNINHVLSLVAEVCAFKTQVLENLNQTSFCPNLGFVITLFPLVFPQFIFIWQHSDAVVCTVASQQEGPGFDSRPGLWGFPHSFSLCLRGFPLGAPSPSHSPKTQAMRLLGYSKGAITLGQVDPCQVKARLRPLPLLTSSHREIMAMTRLAMWLIYSRSISKTTH